MTSNEIRKKFLDFFEKREHKILPSASLVTSDEKGVTNSTLFNTAGMQPLVPYLLGKDHPDGQRLASSQKCLRTTDIDDVGDNTHATFFEMLGNWSLGNYFKEESIKWSFEFLTNKEEGLGLDPDRLYITVFEGDEDAPRDTEAAEIWKKYLPENKIYFLGKDSNWWSAGDNGPCGPDTEIFYDLTSDGLGNLSHEEFLKADNEQKVIEIWNNVFMSYLKENGKVVGKLEKNNVDTGMGLERITAVVNKKSNIFETDLFSDAIEIISKEISDIRIQRIIADHIKSSVFMISDGVLPSNTDRGYILRRLIRKFYTHIHLNKSDHLLIDKVIDTYINKYKETYTNLNSDEIKKVIKDEIEKFKDTLENGIKIFNKIKDSKISGNDAFKLFSSYGFPLDLTIELAKKEGKEVNIEEFNKEFEKHQEQSRTGSAGKFKGGLESHGEQEIRYHTATHLLHSALHEVLGKDALQKGSHIDSERLRFDFSYPEKLTDEQKTEIENIVNGHIKKSLPVTCEEMSYDDAKKIGAIGLFDDKYGDTVSVYKIGDSENGFVSIELCGGPHVKNTNELGEFKIKKEEASSKGVRRIKAILI